MTRTVLVCDYCEQVFELRLTRDEGAGVVRGLAARARWTVRGDYDSEEIRNSQDLCPECTRQRLAGPLVVRSADR
jgi:hypothetical protein